MTFENRVVSMEVEQKCWNETPMRELLFQSVAIRVAEEQFNSAAKFLICAFGLFESVEVVVFC